MALIKLTGKYATGLHSHAIVDDDMLDFLSQWRWKAKPNGGGNNVYAVRNIRVDGKCVTVRMHRVIGGMGMDDSREIDHHNHNSLDNRRANLIPATRSENALNARRVEQIGTCVHCGAAMKRTISACASGNRMMCAVCKAKAGARAKRSAVFFTRCKHCDAHLTARRSDREFCNDTCRCRFRSATGYVRPHRGRIDLPPPAAGKATMAPHQIGPGPSLDKASGRERRLAEFAQR
ncbi:HNH endonuclease [Pandoraea sputorum]|uniref:HNH endonuclease n=1 Tax=Pandoraea sputorum TaxID=93222 RepID=UPI002B28A3EC|nr:hypothetical protein THI4931_04630 [Pandoraea sputorum]